MSLFRNQSGPLPPRDKRVGLAALIFLAPCILGGLFSTSAFAREQSDREEDGLVGTVRSVVTREALLTQTDRYDPAGRILERIQEGIESSQGLWPLRFLYEYDQAGQRLSEKVLDARGELVKETRAVSDERGNRTAEVAAWGDGTFENASFYEFDRDARRTMGLHYNAPQVIDRNLYMYDEHGRLVRETLARNYRYDASGLLVVTSHLFEFGYEVLSRYDERGYVREKVVTDLAGRRQSRSEFAHDERGNQTEEQVFNAKGIQTDRKEYRYEYDAAGNWITETMQWWQLTSGAPQLLRTQVRSRVIQYY